MDTLTQVIDYINDDILYEYVLVILLIGLGIYFTFRTRFVQIRLFREMFRVIKEEVDAKRKGISAFQAWAISTASREGTGNMAGVAWAITAVWRGGACWLLASGG